MSISVEKLLMGRTLKGTYFGGEVKKITIDIRLFNSIS